MPKFFICVLLLLLGCEGARLNAREGGALAGAGLGAGLGAIIGNQVGNQGAAIAIGSAIGALSGGLIGNEYDAADERLSEADRRLDERDRQLQENRRIIEELRGRGADVRSTARGVVVNLPDVLFEFDSAKLTPASRQTARDIAEAVRTSPRRLISVEGHTDSIGTVEYNQRLSLARAQSVVAALNSEGISRGRVTPRGFGESNPIAANNTVAGRQRNRRVEVIIENR